MTIEIKLQDRDGNDLYLGDKIFLYDWDSKRSPLGVATLVWDFNEGRLSTSPCIIEDAYDFYSKAIPLCQKFVPQMQKIVDKVN